MKCRFKNLLAEKIAPESIAHNPPKTISRNAWLVKVKVASWVVIATTNTIPTNI